MVGYDAAPTSFDGVFALELASPLANALSLPVLQRIAPAVCSLQLVMSQRVTGQLVHSAGWAQMVPSLTSANAPNRRA